MGGGSLIPKGCSSGACDVFLASPAEPREPLRQLLGAAEVPASLDGCGRHGVGVFPLPMGC